MSSVAQCAPSRWTDFLSISKNTIPAQHPDAETDLFVGKDITIRITFDNASVTTYRDVVVLGTLIIRALNPADKDNPPLLVARDFFVPSELVVTNVKIQCRTFHQSKNPEEFRSELQELFLEWIDIQRESVNRIGLRSILT